jgi:hypothetical protein
MMLENVELLWRSRRLWQGQHSGDGRDRVAHGKEHALVNPGLTSGRSSFANDAESTRRFECTRYPFSTSELENWRNDPTAHSI